MEHNSCVQQIDFLEAMKLQLMENDGTKSYAAIIEIAKAQALLAITLELIILNKNGLDVNIIQE